MTMTTNRNYAAEAALRQIARNIVVRSTDPGAPLNLFAIETACLAESEMAQVKEMVDSGLLD